MIQMSPLGVCEMRGMRGIEFFANCFSPQIADELAELLSDSAMDPGRQCGVVSRFSLTRLLPLLATVHPRSAADDLFSDIEISRLNDQLQAVGRE